MPTRKKTGLWGKFNRDLPRNDVEPLRVCSQGSWVQRLGGKSDKTKELRSMTPLGFAYAFYAANCWDDTPNPGGLGTAARKAP